MFYFDYYYYTPKGNQKIQGRYTAEEMATAGPVVVAWTPEDDLLLKNAVEAGASLEALAKGAVQFSRRFSFRELRDRWHSLLYDPDVSAQASAHMFELELSGFSPLSRSSRYEHLKGNRELPEKRKRESIRKQYYSMRKKIRSEFFNPSDLGFLDEPNPHESCGNSVLSHLEFLGSEIEILHSAFSKPARDSSVISAAVTNCSSRIKGCSYTHEDRHSNGIVRTYGFTEEVSTSFGQSKTTFEPNGTCRVSIFVDNSSVNFDEHTGDHECSLPQRLEMQRSSIFDSTGDNPQNVIRGSRKEQHLSSPRDDSSYTVGFPSTRPNLPIWEPVDGFPETPMPVSLKEGGATQDAKKMLTDDGAGEGNNSFVYDVIHSGPLLEASEGEFGDLSDSLLNLANDDEMLLVDLDGNETPDKSSSDNLNSFLVSSSDFAPEDGINNLEPEASVISETCLVDPNCVDREKSDAFIPSIHIDHQNVDHPVCSELSESSLALDAQYLGDGNVICSLNTEDPEIPCNDDIFLLIHPSTSYAPACEPKPGDSMDLSSAASQKQISQGTNLMMDVKDVARSSICSQKSGPIILPEAPSSRSLVGSKVKSELPRSNSKDLLPRDAKEGLGDLSHSGFSQASGSLSAGGMLKHNSSRVEFKTGENLAKLLNSQNKAVGTSKTDISEPMQIPLTSDQEESESDDDTPYFSDVEAVILETDLDPHYQDSHRMKHVSRYQSEEIKRYIIRLEQCARSCLQRAMTSRGAFAIFYGRHLKHYIRKTEVTLGRSTDDADVDIDLRKEGCANKISRQQAIIKMEGNGSFYLKNLGKSLISVNGKSVAKGQLICLSSSCLIEIRGMSFVLDTNEKYVRQYANSMAQKSRGKDSKFGWLPGEEA